MTQDFTSFLFVLFLFCFLIFRLIQAVIKFEWPSLLDCIIYKVMFSTIPNASHRILKIDECEARQNILFGICNQMQRQRGQKLETTSKRIQKNTEK